MRIKKQVYENIRNSVNSIPPESGGILGSKENVIVTAVYDRGVDNEKKCSYSPNVKLLNNVIKEWEEHEINFAGIFHSHYFGVKMLSCGDLNYIQNIMRNMPSYVTELYFPLVVMPEKEIVAYKAIKLSNQILIQKEELIIE